MSVLYLLLPKSLELCHRLNSEQTVAPAFTADGSLKGR
jgi:hypothetical protein